MLWRSLAPSFLHSLAPAWILCLARFPEDGEKLKGEKRNERHSEFLEVLDLFDTQRLFNFVLSLAVSENEAVANRGWMSAIEDERRNASKLYISNINYSSLRACNLRWAYLKLVFSQNVPRLPSDKFYLNTHPTIAQ